MAAIYYRTKFEKKQQDKIICVCVCVTEPKIHICCTCILYLYMCPVIRFAKLKIVQK